MDVNELTLLNVPEEADQVADVALPPMIPAKLIVEPEHMVISVPAVAVDFSVTEMGSENVCAGQNPPVLLKLKSIVEFPLLGSVTVNGPATEPLTMAPVGQVQK